MPVVLKTREPSVYGLTEAQEREVYLRLGWAPDTPAVDSSSRGVDSLP